ncbi:MAG: efflux RND transporter permease subunit [Myxococcota bacterium]
MTLFFKNPRVLAIAVGLVVVAGLSTLSVIVRQEDPTITNGIAVVVSPFPGATAERVEALVTEKLEDELREVSEIQTLSSVSRNGISVVTVEIDEQIQGNDTAEAFAKIRDAVDDAQALFPPGLPEPILDDDRFGSYTLILGLAWAMDSPAELGIMRRFAQELQDRLRDVSGTDTVSVFGAPAEEIVVQIDPASLAAAGLTAAQVGRALSRADAKVAAGVVRGERNTLLIELEGELDSIERIRRVPLSAGRDGQVLQVGDIATVERGLRSPASDLARVDRRAATVVAAQLAAGKRFDVWSERTTEVVEAFRSELPHGIELEVVFDQAVYTRARLDGLMNNLATGLLLVVVILFLTMGWRSALIVTLTLPLVSLASLTVLYALGVPIHQMSVTGLIVALGLLVDNAIVVTDAIRSKRVAGASELVAVRDSLRHLWSPLLSSTLTTVFGFMPILLLPGRVGEFVGTIGLSVIVSLICSYALAMTVVPAFAGRFLPPSASNASNSIWSSGLSLPRAGLWFRRSLDWSLKHPKRSMALASLLPICGYLGASTLPRQFFPPADRDQFNVEMWLPRQSSIEETERVALDVDLKLRAHDEIESVHWFIGRSAPPNYYNLRQSEDGNASYAQAQVQIESVEALNELLPRLQEELDQEFPNAQILVRELLQGPPVNAPIEYRIYGPDITVLRSLGEELRERMTRVSTVTHSMATLTAGSPKLRFRPDENEARMIGLQLLDIAGQLNVSLEGMPGGSILEGNEEIPIRVRVGDETRSNVERVRATALIAPGMQSEVSGYRGIPLESLVDTDLRPVLDGIPHRNGRRVNTIRGYTHASVFPETAFTELREILAADPIEVPPGYDLEIGGDAAERKEAMGSLFAFVPVLVVLMLAVVALSLNSFRLAAVIFAVAIQSMGLGFLSLTVLRYPLGFQAMIGQIGLIGVAINAAIIINAALQTRPAALAGSVDDIRDTVIRDTSRHIISTTITTFGGFLPLILTPGGFWPPFATGIAGGVLLSTVVSFYFVPAAFLVITRRRPVTRMDSEPAVLTAQPEMSR